MEQRFVNISENISIPVPKDITPEKEAEWLARYLQENDLKAMESDYQELTKIIEEGDLVSFEQVLKDMEEMNRSTKRESA